MQRRPPPSVARRGAVRPQALPAVLALPRRSPLHPELARALAAADALHVLETDLTPVPVRPTAARVRSGCYRSREGDPIDVRISAQAGSIPLSFLHELGHLVDHQLHPEARRFASTGHPVLRRWRAAIRGLPSRAPRHAGPSHRRYFDSFKELWARSYAQTVLRLAPDPRLRDHLAELQRAGDPCVWAEDAFAPVAAEVADALARLGILRLRPAV